MLEIRPKNQKLNNPVLQKVAPIECKRRNELRDYERSISFRAVIFRNGIRTVKWSVDIYIIGRDLEIAPTGKVKTKYLLVLLYPAV